MQIYVLELTAMGTWRGEDYAVNVKRACASVHDAQALADKFKHAVATSGGFGNYCPQLELVGEPTTRSVQIA